MNITAESDTKFREVESSIGGRVVWDAAFELSLSFCIAFARVCRFPVEVPV